MASRLSDISIVTRLYALLIASTLGVAAILALAIYCLMTYRINGPVYSEIKRIKSVESAIVPPVMYEAYITLQEMETLSGAEEIRDSKARFERLAADYDKARASWLRTLPADSESRRHEADRHAAASKLTEIAREKYMPLLKANQPKDEVKPKSKNDPSTVLRTELMPEFQKLRRASDKMIQSIEEESQQIESRAESSVNFWTRTLIVVSLATILIGGLVGWFAIRAIARTTNQLLKRVGELASGASDLTVRLPVESRDEMGRLAAGINAMIEKIQSVVAKVRESSIQLLSTASEIAATARQQGATVQGLSSSTAQVAAAVREITATGKELSGTMNEVNARAGQAATLAASGRSRLANMESTMGQLVESTAQISSKLASIREKADSINVVVTTITKVADQTNLLSINAAIEAEKAGEYGRGFLVVAREIRRLADQTAVATLDIENMVRHMQEAVTTGVMQMDKFSDEVRSGVGRVAEINGQTGQIIEEVHALTDRYHQVNESMRNQSIGAEQINEAMANMTGNIRETAAALEEFNRATAHLRNSVEMLNQEIAQFRI
jgi:methyl-accepting chemotaxis protein WspA